MFQIITFYEFKRLSEVGALENIKEALKDAMRRTGVRGTIILAEEGFNSTVCGTPSEIGKFVPIIEKILSTTLAYKSSYYDAAPLRKIDVKIKPEIVALRKQVDISKGAGTHVNPQDWNRLIAEEDIVILDTRNDYEYLNGTFRGAINPGTTKFSELPDFVAANLNPERDKKVAMFCTGGIRCEKFAPYLKEMGFKEVFQLEGGILRYLEEVPTQESLWEGECFVFDERVTVDASLRKGVGRDHSQRHKDETGE